MRASPNGSLLSAAAVRAKASFLEEHETRVADACEGHAWRTDFAIPIWPLLPDRLDSVLVCKNKGAQREKGCRACVARPYLLGRSAGSQGEYV